ncbi:TetR/AcrR family transcriptional regulator [Sulfitobacter sp. HNIBRBA3233]|uniref:TetR/AcrR family transcriptional regulator n=1 Tax=Sulfitobacter marinivivus TaxID=3158558 RepID=UPI0032DE7FF8
MQGDKKQKRHEAIAAAAYGLLAEKGYDGASMLSIARSAKASNETLYRWYGDKRGLFEALVRDNAADIRRRLEAAIEQGDAPRHTLRTIAPLLLSMLLGERAVLLNRAAAADPSGELGMAISAGGREVIQPLIGQVMARLGPPDTTDLPALTDLFVSLLIGDSQIKRVIGVQPVPTPAWVKARSDRALAAFFALLERG